MHISILLFVIGWEITLGVMEACVEV